MTLPDDIPKALRKTCDYLVSAQSCDGTWSGLVKSDVRATAFYLNTVQNLDRLPDETTDQMEVHLAKEQLEDGGWEKWPGSGPDVDVTLVCTLALANANTPKGSQARCRAEKWLQTQRPPEIDSFWLGYLAMNGHLKWSDVPHLTPRLVTNPRWVRPNIFDFSFLRLAVVATSLLQEQSLKSRPAHPRDVSPKQTFEHNPEFTAWFSEWLESQAKTKRDFLSVISGALRSFDRLFPTSYHRLEATNWLITRQESDGSFFSSVHMTSAAVITLYRIDASLYADRIESGLRALRNWHVTDESGVWQQFTDCTNWDTILNLDLLQLTGSADYVDNVDLACGYLMTHQNRHAGDWSARVPQPVGGAWGFQRASKWYPDCDDTAFASLALLSNWSEACLNASVEGAKWLVSMQCSNGGWASWDRNDRSWMKIPKGGPWFARDLPTVDITSRAVILLRRVLSHTRDTDEQLSANFQRALVSGVEWVKKQQVQGRWYGSWFTHYLYGTSHALEMLEEVGQAIGSQTTERWLRSIVNQDGGFGEAPNSGPENGYVAAPSTPFHTACGLLSLCFCGSAKTDIAHRAAKWLLEHQEPNGTWTNGDFFAAGVPGLWYANFSNTPTYFAAKSLHVYKEKQEDVNCP